MNSTENLTRTNTPLLRASQVAQQLNISRALAYRLMQTGEIPSVRFNRSVRVRPSDLDAYILRNMQPSNQ